jgi:hypothetical protein
VPPLPVVVEPPLLVAAEPPLPPLPVAAELLLPEPVVVPVVSSPCPAAPDELAPLVLDEPPDPVGLPPVRVVPELSIGSPDEEHPNNDKVASVEQTATEQSER